MNLFFKSHQTLLNLFYFQFNTWISGGMALFGIITFTTWAPCAHAISLQSIYTAACQRDIGLIMQVNENDLQFLSLDGNLKKIPKYEIIYLAEYPSEILPMKEFKNPSELDFYRISTLSQKEGITTLVEGWPIGFTEDRLAFLSVDGKESAVSRRSFFSLSEEKITSTQRLSSIHQNKYYKYFKFIPPYQFRDCPEDSFSKDGSTPVYPQQIWSQPVMIKRELDQFRSEAERLKKYVQEQKFYSIPEVYENFTSLGLWHTFGYRHGGSVKRMNNFAPILIDSYSSDIFNYQHQFVAGSAPIASSFHEEPQMHSLYQFKASYFHFFSLFDPNVILVGRNYKWQNNDFDSIDDKWNNVSQIESGFDFGSWSFKIFLNDTYQVGIYKQTELLNDYYSMSHFGLQYRNQRFSLEGIWGQSKNENKNELNPHQNRTQLDARRINLSLYKVWKMDWMLSLIQREVHHSGSLFYYKSANNTLAAYVNYPLSSRYRVGGFISLEDQKKNYLIDGNWQDKHSTYFKLGTHFSLNF